MIEDVKAIDNAIRAFKNNGMVLKVLKGFQDYLSCEMKFSQNKKRAWQGQPHLIKNMKKKFGAHVQDVQSYKTPGMSKFLIIRPLVDNEKFSMEHQWEYWWDGGMLLYLVKHPHCNLANVSRRLSKANDIVNPAA